MPKDEFQSFIKNDVYPFSLVVATSVSDLKEINKKYQSIDREELKARKCSEATTYPVFERKTNKSAVCIVFNSKPTIRLITHESLHATYLVLSILCHIPLNDYTDECYAYLIGWIAEKINESVNFN